MTVNYLDIIGDYYETAEVYTEGDPTNYNDLVWETTPISQAELDAVWLVDYKTQKLIYFSELATEDVVSGFDSSALGTPHHYDSQPEDQLNLVGSVATNTDMFYACRAYTNAYQIVNVGGARTGTDSTGLPNNTTHCDCEIKFEGASTYLSIQGQDAQTYQELIDAINADLDFSDKGVASIENGNIKIESKVYGASSTVQILDADLFNRLTTYSTIETAVAGEDPSEATKDYRWHTNAQLVTVTQDGANVKLTTLQKFNVKKQQILNAVDVAAVDAITWN